MFELEITQKGVAPRRLTVQDDAMVGRQSVCDVRLDHWRVAKEHARLYRTPSGIAIEDLGAMGGIAVNGHKTLHHGPLQPDDRVEIGPFTLHVFDATLAAIATAPRAPDAPIVASGDGAHRSPPDEQADPRQALEFHWRKRIHEKLIETLDLRRRDVSGMSDAELRVETESLVREIIATLGADIPDALDRDALRKHSINEAIGLGPLEDLLADERVTEIMVNRHDEIYVERAGRLARHAVAFTGDRAVMGVIERIVAPIGRRIDESSPMVDARLKDGSRVNAIIPPLALKGPTITIRKFAKRRLTVDDLIGFDAIDASMAAFLRICVEQRKNIVVAGGTGSGKTTLLNILSNFIPEGERIITIEDAAELRLHHAHRVSLEARPANVEGRGQVSIRDLVKNALRMRPDRIVVGECRGAEALDMLQAMNTGHEGSLTTLHANSPRDALARLETMVLMAGMDLPLVAIREQVTSAVDILVQQSRFSCGARKVTRIVEITGMEAGRVQLQELFRYEQTGRDAGGRTQGVFTGCDLLPTFAEEFAATGRPLDLDLFKRRTA